MIIYKYFSQEGAKAALGNESVLLKCPTEYNDPFDCLFFVDKKEKEKAFKLFINYSFFEEFYRLIFIEKRESKLPKTSIEALKSSVADIVENIKKTKRYTFRPDIRMYHWLASLLAKDDLEENRPAFNKIIDETIPMIKEAAMVSCFSLGSKSILMWSHYGEKHKGACFEYEVDDERVFRRVKYQKKVRNFELSKLLEIALGHKFLNEKIDASNDLYDFALKPLFTKSKEWEYEKEVRCVFSSKEMNPDISPFGDFKLLKMPCPKRIILGCEASDDFIKDVKKLSGDIPVEKLIKPDGEYSLDDRELL